MRPPGIDRAARRIDPMQRVIRMLVTSAAATAVDVCVLAALALVAGTEPGPAATLGCLAGGIVSFALSRGWVFDAADGSAVRQAASYGVIVVLGGALLSGLLVQVLCDALAAPVLVAKAGAAAAVMLGWNYPMSARVVFRRAEEVS